ncbi:MAG: sugar transferase [Chloroflexi bacterium]|nr:sugar transferase [Chloroflexota bacterium]
MLATLLLLPVWIALWMLIPALIWLEDRGPVFYRQLRVGKDGKTFTLLKFRTMVPNAELLGPVWTSEDDPRITGVGKILRRTGLDELPEVLSIFKGDMSLVGPRPLPAREQWALEGQVPGFEQRLKVRPGLTGLAQVADPFDDPHVKLTYDLEYIRSMSPWLDIKLLLLSVRNTFAAKWDRRGGKPAAAEGISDQTRGI